MALSYPRPHRPNHARRLAAAVATALLAAGVLVGCSATTGRSAPWTPSSPAGAAATSSRSV